MSDPKLPLAPSPPNAAVRERVQARLQRLAKLAVIAAAPVLNTACDPAPDPYCQQSDAGTWKTDLSATAAWALVADGGTDLQIEVKLTSTNNSVSASSSGYTATGGTISSSEATDTGVVIRVVPDAGATEIKVSGQIYCDTLTGSLDILLTPSGTPAAGAKVPATIQ
ncbi:MAG: hypothetical protein U0359_13560 [Byssovorax sp.]